MRFNVTSPRWLSQEISRREAEDRVGDEGHEPARSAWQSKWAMLVQKRLESVLRSLLYYLLEVLSYHF